MDSIDFPFFKPIMRLHLDAQQARQGSQCHRSQGLTQASRIRLWRVTETHCTQKNQRFQDFPTVSKDSLHRLT
jgi:hypothetical protein